jgi:hypothetical protein
MDILLTMNIGPQRKFIFTYIYYRENKNLKYLINNLRMKLDLYVKVILGTIERNKLEYIKKMTTTTTTTFYLHKYQLEFYLKINIRRIIHVQ